MANTFNCPVCGKEQGLTNPYSIYSLRCSNCASLLVNQNGKFYADEDQTKLNVPLPKSRLSLGMRANLGNGTSMIIGRVCSTSGKYTWSEWLMMSSGGLYFWLIEDEDSFSLMRKFTPITPFDPIMTRAGRVPFEGTTLEIEDRGTSEVIGFEGELTWKACAGDRMDYLDGYTEVKGKETLYSIEWSNSEIVFYRGQELDKGFVYKQFGLSGVSSSSKGFGSKINSFWPQFFIYCTLLFLVSLVSCNMAESSAELVTPLGYTKEDQAEGTITYGPYVLDKTTKVSKIEIRTILRNDEFSGDVFILNKDKKAIRSFPFKFYHESDEDGSSSKLSMAKYYLLEEKGEYYVKIASDPENMSFMKKIILVVHQNGKNPEPFHYLLWLSGIPIILAIALALCNNKDDD